MVQVFDVIAIGGRLTHAVLQQAKSPSLEHNFRQSFADGSRDR
jgi:hypothetical protein